MSLAFPPNTADRCLLRGVNPSTLLRKGCVSRFSVDRSCGIRDQWHGRSATEKDFATQLPLTLLCLVENFVEASHGFVVALDHSLGSRCVQIQSFCQARWIGQHIGPRGNSSEPSQEILAFP